MCLTFFGEYRGHGHPHESPRSMTVPLLLLAVPSAFIGLINATARHREVHRVGAFHVPGVEFQLAPPRVRLRCWRSSRPPWPSPGSWWRRWVYYWKQAPQGVCGRSPALRGLHTLLVEKYYLDRLFVDGVVGFIKGPLARAIYWTNQKIIDGMVNAVGVGAKIMGRFTYDILDQKGVDGIVNGIGDRRLGDRRGPASGAVRPGPAVRLDALRRRGPPRPGADAVFN